MPGSRALRVGQQVALGLPWPWRVQSQSSSCLLSRGNLSPQGGRESCFIAKSSD